MASVIADIGLVGLLLNCFAVSNHFHSTGLDLTWTLINEITGVNGWVNIVMY